MIYFQVTVLFAAIVLAVADPGVGSPLVTPLTPVPSIGYTFPSAPLAYSRYFGNAASQVDLRQNYYSGYPAYAAPIARYPAPSQYVSKYAVPSPYAGLYGHPSLHGIGYGGHGPAFF